MQRPCEITLYPAGPRWQSLRHSTIGFPEVRCVCLELVQNEKTNALFGGPGHPCGLIAVTLPILYSRVRHAKALAKVHKSHLAMVANKANLVARQTGLFDGQFLEHRVSQLVAVDIGRPNAPKFDHRHVEQNNGKPQSPRTDILF